MGTQILTERLCNTAHHESGHAVAAFFLNVSIRDVSIVANDDSLGRLRHHRLNFGKHGLFNESPAGIDRAERHILVCYAGPLASRKFLPRSRWRADGSTDFDSAAKLFSFISGQDEKATSLYARLLWRRAECLVDFRWKEITAVAADMLERDTLTRADISAVIDRVHGLTPFPRSLAAGG